MKRILSCLIAIATAAPLLAETTTRYVVATRRPARLAEMRMLRDAAEADRHEVREFREFDGFAADLTSSEVAELRRSKEVRYISEVVPRHATGTAPFSQKTNSSVYDRRQVVSWGIDAIRAREVWPMTKGDNTTVHVAIIDTGMDRTHPDLLGKYAGGYNTFTRTEDPIDDNKHGTHVAGIIAANDNFAGTLGAAPNMKIWAVKSLDLQGNGTDESVMAGFEWILAKKKEIGGNWIVNLSIGGIRTSAAEVEFFRKLVAENILVVAAAGNRGVPGVDFPAAHRNVLSVCALERDLTRAGFSSFGLGLQICAPGVAIPSTVPAGLAAVGDVTAGEDSYFGSFVTGSPKGEITGPFVYCGLGRPEDFPPTAAGRIAVIRRGSATADLMYFNEKVKNAKAAKTIAVVLINNVEADPNWPWTLIPLRCDNSGCRADNPEDETYPFPLTVSLSMADGARLLANPTKNVTVSYRDDFYAPLTGTSMAAPHAVAAAALAWSIAPTATAEELRVALILTCRDLNTPGWDMSTGYGLVDAYKAAQFLNPEAFGLVERPAVDWPRRRSSGGY